MKIYKATDYRDMSRKAANIISAQIIMKPGWVLPQAPPPSVHTSSWWTGTGRETWISPQSPQ